MPPNIFVSYSHADSSLVVPVVALLRASKALVFRDADSIRPGKRWPEEVATAIAEASVVVVFWCHHAKNSQEVEKEFLAAISHGKDVLPLLLDETPLPRDLTEFQYIDFREAFGTGHGIDSAPPLAAPAPAKASRKVWGISLGVAALLATVGTSMWLPRAPSPHQFPPPILHPNIPDVIVPSGGHSILWFSALVVGVVLPVVLLLLCWARKLPLAARRSPTEYRLRPSDHQMLLARTIEAELVRRTGASAT